MAYRHLSLAGRGKIQVLLQRGMGFGRLPGNWAGALPPYPGNLAAIGAGRPTAMTRKRRRNGTSRNARHARGACGWNISR